MSEFSLSTREANLERLANETFDIAVIGGGITGAGIALDAASRGLKVGLVEKGDFASGTSSRSSRLIHGGIRYLQQREFGLVYEALSERQRLLRMAPHLVHPLRFLIPVFKGSNFDDLRGAIRAGLWAYDVTGGARIGHFHQHLRVDEAEKLGPALRGASISDAFVYWDAINDDARMTVGVARTAAVRYGAALANYCRVEEIDSTDGRISGFACRDLLGDSTFRVSARAVVSAAGVWRDQVAELATPRGGRAEQMVRPAKGVHVVVPKRCLPGDVASLLPVRGEDRFIFTIPWGERTILGTTDTDYNGPLDDPRADDGEIDYILETVNAWVTEPIRKSDITATYAGLRPLAEAASTAKTADMSRRHRVESSKAGLISVYGGKFTTWRKMAEDAVDFAGEKLLGSVPKSLTKRLQLDGAMSVDESTTAAIASASDSVGPDLARHLAQRFGTHARAVAAIADSTEGARQIIAGLGYIEAEVVYSAKYEMAATVDDILTRRMRATSEDAVNAAAAAPRVAVLMGAEHGWTPETREAQVDAYTTVASDGMPLDRG